MNFFVDSVETHSAFSVYSPHDCNDDFENWQFDTLKPPRYEYISSCCLDLVVLWFDHTLIDLFYFHLNDFVSHN
jgi:hypothetical protein